MGEDGSGSGPQKKDMESGKRDTEKQGQGDGEAGILEAKQLGRECPVPKPRVLLGSLLRLHTQPGEEQKKDSSENG